MAAIRMFWDVAFKFLEPGEMVGVLILASIGCWLAASLLALANGTNDRPYLALGVLGSVLACASAVVALWSGTPSAIEFMFWRIPARLEVDALSAAFLLPLHVVACLGILFGNSYWSLASQKVTGRTLRCFFGLLVASMTAVFIVRQGVLFLIVWEAMALFAFFLIGTEHERPEVSRASWIYLVSTHTGTIALTLMVMLLAQRTGGYVWGVKQLLPASVMDSTILILALAGFGFKAGFLPLHFWLPAAHAGAPSHVSAILSAVMLKAGIYGILRISTLLPTPPFLGGFLLILGAATALFGVANALAQGDYKRLLAYSSIENIGIILMAVGLGWTGRAYHNPWLAALGFGGALFHVWNHAIFKSLLFFGAGSVLHATGTREIEALGGLASRMPRTAVVLLPGILAVAALPPCNGFVSEWFLYRGLFVSLLQGYPWSAYVGLPALALTGGLAGVAFAKFFGIAFLGEPRSPAAVQAHDPGPSMWLPMAFLAMLCLAMSLGSVLLLPVLDRVLAVLSPESVGLLAPGMGRDLGVLAWMSALLLLLGLGAFLWLRRGASKAPQPPTWDCGYARPTARMQYSASSFADGWAALLPGMKLRVRRIKNLFPGTTAFGSDFKDLVGEGFLAPRIDRLATRLLRFRSLQPGFLPVYILYVLLALLGVFLWMLARPRLLG